MKKDSLSVIKIIIAIITLIVIYLSKGIFYEIVRALKKKSVFAFIVFTVILFLLFSKTYCLNVYNYGSEINQTWFTEFEKEIPDHLKVVKNIVLEKEQASYGARVYINKPDTIYFSNFKRCKETVRQIFYHELGHCIQLTAKIHDYDYLYKIFPEVIVEVGPKHWIKEDFAETFRIYMTKDVYETPYNKRVVMSEYLNQLR